MCSNYSEINTQITETEIKSSHATINVSSVVIVYCIIIRYQVSVPNNSTIDSTGSK